MKIKSAFRLLFSLLPGMAGGGCATHALWTTQRLDDFNTPAENVNLRLYADDSRNDVLVVYNEYSERHDVTRTRAYYLRENQTRIAQQRAPVFAATKSFSTLKPVPVFLASNAVPALVPPLYAVLSTNSQSFTLFCDGNVTGPFDLPAYNDGKGEMERIVLTPLAATADLTIVGGVIGCIYARGLYESSPAYQNP